MPNKTSKQRTGRRSLHAVDMRQRRWTTKSYRRNAIPNTGWMVAQGPKLIMNEMTKQAALQLAKDHNDCLPHD